MKTPTFCNRHRLEISSFCENCEEGICRMCYGLHKKHIIQALQYIFPKYQSLAINEMIPKLIQRHADLENICSIWEAKVHSIKRKKVQNERFVSSQLNSIKKTLEKRTNLLLDKIRRMAVNEIDDCEKEITYVRGIISSVKDCKSKANKLADSDDSSYLMSYRGLSKKVSMIERFVVECMEMEPEARMGLGELELSSTKELYFQIHKLDIKSQRRTHEEQHKTADNEKKEKSDINNLRKRKFKESDLDVTSSSKVQPAKKVREDSKTRKETSRNLKGKGDNQRKPQQKPKVVKQCNLRCKKDLQNSRTKQIYLDLDKRGINDNRTRGNHQRPTISYDDFNMFSDNYGNIDLLVKEQSPKQYIRDKSNSSHKLPNSKSASFHGVGKCFQITSHCSHTFSNEQEKERPSTLNNYQDMQDVPENCTCSEESDYSSEEESSSEETDSSSEENDSDYETLKTNMDTKNNCLSNNNKVTNNNDNQNNISTNSNQNSSLFINRSKNILNLYNNTQVSVVHVAIENCHSNEMNVDKEQLVNNIDLEKRLPVSNNNRITTDDNQNYVQSQNGQETSHSVCDISNRNIVAAERCLTDEANVDIPSQNNTDKDVRPQQEKTGDNITLQDITIKKEPVDKGYEKAWRSQQIKQEVQDDYYGQLGTGTNSFIKVKTEKADPELSSSQLKNDAIKNKTLGNVGHGDSETVVSEKTEVDNSGDDATVEGIQSFLEENRVHDNDTVDTVSSLNMENEQWNGTRLRSEDGNLKDNHYSASMSENFDSSGNDAEKLPSHENRSKDTDGQSCHVAETPSHDKSTDGNNNRKECGKKLYQNLKVTVHNDYHDKDEEESDCKTESRSTQTKVIDHVTTDCQTECIREVLKGYILQMRAQRQQQESFGQGIPVVSASGHSIPVICNKQLIQPAAPNPVPYPAQSSVVFNQASTGQFSANVAQINPTPIMSDYQQGNRLSSHVSPYVMTNNSGMRLNGSGISYPMTRQQHSQWLYQARQQLTANSVPISSWYQGYSYYNLPHGYPTQLNYKTTTSTIDNTPRVRSNPKNLLNCTSVSSGQNALNSISDPKIIPNFPVKSNSEDSVPTASYNSQTKHNSFAEPDIEDDHASSESCDGTSIQNVKAKSFLYDKEEDKDQAVKTDETVDDEQSESETDTDSGKEDDTPVRNDPGDTVDNPIDIDDEDVEEIGSLLENFKAGKHQNLRLVDVAGCLVEFSLDAHGSHFLQSKVVQASMTDLTSVMKEMLDSGQLSDLLKDHYSYLVISAIIIRAAYEKCRDFLRWVCFDAGGSYVMQKVFSTVLPDTRRVILQELDGSILRLIKDVIGHIVILTCIEVMPPIDLKSIIQMCTEHVESLSFNKYGSLVLQKLISEMNIADVRCLVEAILKHGYILMSDQNGIKVLNLVIMKGSIETGPQIVSWLKTNLIMNCCDQTKSTVIVKCLSKSHKDHSSDLIKEICLSKDSTFLDLLTNKYGSAVIQCMVQVAKPHHKRILMKKMQPHKELLVKNSLWKDFMFKENF